MNNVTQSVQRALQAYIQDAGLSFVLADQVYTSLLDESAVVPNVLCKCQRALCTVSTDGNWRGMARLELRESADDTTEAEHFDNAGELFALFATASMAADISEALDNFTCFYLRRVEQGWAVDGRLWVSYLEIELDCCTSNQG